MVFKTLKQGKMISFALFFTLSGIMLPCQSYCEKVWKMTSLSWGPYADEKADSMGTTTKLLTDLLADEGIRLVVEFYPWERAKKKARSREYAGYFPAWPEEVMEGFRASPIIDWSEIAVLKKSGVNFNFTSLRDLFCNYKIGLISSYQYPQEIQIYIKQYSYNIDEAPDEISLMKKLVNGRHNFAITDPNVMKYYAEPLEIRNFETVRVIMRKELVVAMRDDEENRERIELLYRILKKSGIK